MRPNRTEENSATKGLLFAIRGAEFKVNRNPNVDELMISDHQILIANEFLRGLANTAANLY